MPESPGDTIVARLIAAPPHRMSELEAIVGPIRMSFAREDGENMGLLMRPRIPKPGESAARPDFSPALPRLSVSYHFDVHHERPERPRDVRLSSYSLAVRGDRAVTEARLLQRFGTPRKATHATKYVTTVFAAYHPFYVAAGKDGTYTLEWHEERPEWSFDTPEPDARRGWLKGLCSTIQRARSVDEIDKYCKVKSGAAGIEILGSYNSSLNPYAEFQFPLDDARDYWLRFRPRYKASMFAEVFGWAPAIGYSGDVHLSTWAIQRRDDNWYPISGVLDQWELHATLSGGPSGEELPARGACIPRAIGDKDEVESLSIRPRFR